MFVKTQVPAGQGHSAPIPPIPHQPIYLARAGPVQPPPSTQTEPAVAREQISHVYR